MFDIDLLGFLRGRWYVMGNMSVFRTFRSSPPATSWTTGMARRLRIAWQYESTESITIRIWKREAHQGMGAEGLRLHHSDCDYRSLCHAHGRGRLPAVTELSRSLHHAAFPGRL